MYIDNSGVIISIKKIISNIKRHFLVLIVAILGAIAIIAISSATNETGSTFTVTHIMQIRTQTVDGIDPLIVEGQKVADEFYVYLSADGVRDKISEGLDEEGYATYSSSDLPIFTATNNVITMKVQGSDKDRTDYISEIILEEFNQYVESYDKGIECRVLDKSVVEVKNERGVIETIITSKNMALLLLGVFLGVILICVFIIFDDRIYVKEDLYFINGLQYLYTAKKNVNVETVHKIIEHYKQENSHLLIASIRNSNKFNFIKESENVIAVNEPENLKYFMDNKVKIIVLFAAEEDTKQEAEDLIHLLKSLEKEVVGFILTV